MYNTRNQKRKTSSLPSWKQIPFSRSFLRQSKILNFLENNDQVFSWKSTLLKDPEAFWRDQDEDPFFESALSKAKTSLKNCDFNTEHRLRSREVKQGLRKEINAKIFRRGSRVGEKVGVANSRDMKSIMSTIRSSSVLVFELGSSDLGMVERFLVALQRMKRDGVRRKIVLVSDIMTWGDSGTPGYEQGEGKVSEEEGEHERLGQQRFQKMSKILEECRLLMNTKQTNIMDGVKSLDQPKFPNTSNFSNQNQDLKIKSEGDSVLNLVKLKTKDSNILANKKNSLYTESQNETTKQTGTTNSKTLEITGTSSLVTNNLSSKGKGWKDRTFKGFEALLKDLRPALGKKVKLPPRKGKYVRRVGIEYAKREMIEGKAQRRKWGGGQMVLDDTHKRVFKYFKRLYGDSEQFRNRNIEEAEEILFGVGGISSDMDFYEPKGTFIYFSSE